MGVTMMQNMINPEVMGDMIDAKIEAQLKITPYAKVDTTLQGVAGDTKTVPKWAYIGDAVDVAEGDEVALTEMHTDKETFTVKKAMKAVGITQEAINSGLGNPVGQAESQLSKAVAGKVDNDVLEAAYRSNNIYNGTASDIGYAGIVEAVGKFVDEEDGVDKVMFIHPKQETTLLKDSDFLSADKFEAGVAINGAIGKIAGCWVKKSKKVAYFEAVSAVTGVYTITIGTKAIAGDRIKVNGVELIAGVDFALSTDTAAGNATGIAAALNASDNPSVSCYTWSASGAVVTGAEDTGKEGAGVPVVEVTKYGASGSLAVTVATTTKGVAAVVAHYANVIIKTEPDSAETEFTEDELPALTIFLKKDIQVDHDWKPRTQTHEITVSKYYGVALTNAEKVVIANFAS